MPRQTKPYPDQFKREAVDLVKITDRPIRQIAEEIGVADQTLRNWIAADEAARGGSPGRLPDDEREELKALRKENKRLRMEREILKKSRGLLRGGGRVEVKKAFNFIHTEKVNFRWR